MTQQINHSSDLIMISSSCQLFYNPFNLKNNNKIKTKIQNPKIDKFMFRGSNKTLTSIAAFFRFSYNLSDKFRSTAAGMAENASAIPDDFTKNWQILYLKRWQIQASV